MMFAFWMNTQATNRRALLRAVSAHCASQPYPLVKPAGRAAGNGWPGDVNTNSN